MRVDKRSVLKLARYLAYSEGIRFKSVAANSALGDNAIGSPSQEMIDEIRAEMPDDHDGSEAEFILQTWLYNLILSAFEEYGHEPLSDELTDEEAEFISHVFDHSRVFTKDSFADNAYLRDIHIPETIYGDFQLRYNRFDPFEMFNYKPPVPIGVSLMVPCIGCFDDVFDFPCISQRSIGSVWMSITPNEIFTMQEPIDRASGKVLTLGLGMGYFTYMCSLKENVESVTVVECEQDVIDMFNEYILPQFKTKDKIRIIKVDAVEFVRDMKDGDYDYCFADIWKSAFEFEAYFAVEEICKRFTKTKVDHWIEDSFLAYLLNIVWQLVLSTVFRELDDAMFKLPPIDDTYQKMWDYLEKLYSGVTLKGEKDITDLMRLADIRRRIRSTNLKF